MINGSKGAVTLVLKMFDQLVCFIGCHMPASGVKVSVCEVYGQLMRGGVESSGGRVYGFVLGAVLRSVCAPGSTLDAN